MKNYFVITQYNIYHINEIFKSYILFLFINEINIKNINLIPKILSLIIKE